MKRIISIFLIAFPLTACASSLSEERKDYILARPHGFIDLTITDGSIPNVIARYGSDKVSKKPESCTISISADSETFLSRSVYPDGLEPSYKISSGFRFPMPVGAHELNITYEDCRASPTGEAEAIKASTNIYIENNMIHEIFFTDGQITDVKKYLNEEVTLKQILDAVKK